MWTVLRERERETDLVVWWLLLFAVQPRPLVLKGTGTGAEASATGVLRDVLTILNSLQHNHL